MGMIQVLFGAIILLCSIFLSTQYQMRVHISSFLNKMQTIRGIQILGDQRSMQTSLSMISSTKLYSQSPTRRNGLGKPKGFWDVKSRYVLERQTLSGLPDKSKPFLVLGIESSCDDTGAAIVRSDGVVLSNVVYSQYEIHQKFGGIVPSLAMEAHKGNIEKAVSEAIQQAGLLSLDEVDAIAVTRGPGLEICLRVGYQKAQVDSLN
jgi:tRNA N6-adenosine threonylcarbamoyltransferase